MKLAPKYAGPTVVTDKVSPLVVKLADLNGNGLGTYYLNDLKISRLSKRQILLQSINTESTTMSSIISNESKAGSHASSESLILNPLTKTLAFDTIISSQSNDIISPSSSEPEPVTPTSLPTIVRPILTPKDVAQLNFGRIPKPLVQPRTVTMAATPAVAV